MKQLLPLCLMALCGCSTTNITKLAQAMAKDNATIFFSVSSVYGTVKFIRTNPGSTNSCTVSPDGTVTVGAKP
jgi:hypothetical protein